MNKVFISVLLLMLLCFCAYGQPTPSTPPSAESLGLQAPEPSSDTQSPTTSESSQTLMSTTESSARSAAPTTLATSSTSVQAVSPQGVFVPNGLYIPYSPSTVASCYYGQWLPLWLDVSGTGPMYIYEWYPSGRLDTGSLGFVQNPGWKKMWFYGDATGWHVLQYYCGGWSNYVYVYVYGSYPTPTPTPTPPSSYPPSPYPPTTGCNAYITVTSSWMSGYSVYVDGNYIGGDGRRSDSRNGQFSFSVSGNQQHTIRVLNQGFSYSQTKTYNCGNSYTLNV